MKSHTILKRKSQLEMAGRRMNVDAYKYIEENFYPHCIENLMRIERGTGLTSELRVIVDTWDREHRTREEYFLDILISWMGEEHARIKIIESLDLDLNEWILQKDGTDAERRFIKSSEANSDPDLRLYNKVSNRSIGLEVAEDRSGFVMREGLLDLRVRKNGSSKVEDLIARSNSGDYEKVFIAVPDWKNNKIGLIEVNNDLKYMPVSYNWAYRKNTNKVIVDTELCFNNLQGLRDII